MNTITTRDAILERYNTFLNRDAGLDPASRKMIFKAYKRTLGPWLPADKNAAILDIGCGEGNFLAFLRDLGYTNLHGFDASPENVALCRERGFPSVVQHDALALNTFKRGSKYQTIFCLDLIEHLPKQDVWSFLVSVRERLQEGGDAVFQTPNMGCVHGLFHRYYCVSHEYGMNERTAVGLLMAAGFPERHIEVAACWHATTPLGYLREVYLRFLHKAVWLAEDRGRPRIPTKNLLIRGLK